MKTSLLPQTPAHVKVNKIIRRCKNALRKYGSADRVINKETIEALDAYITEAEDSELKDAVTDILHEATKIPVNNSHLSKAIRRFIKVADCKHTAPIWYKKASKVIKGEKLSFLDNACLWNVDITLEDNTTSKRVRRIVEKRVGQAYYKSHKADTVDSNEHRSRIRQGVSYQLSNMGQIDPDEKFRRYASSHWKKSFDKARRKVVYRPKTGYQSYAEAELAVKAHALRHPSDDAMTPYRCIHCNCFHIGHEYRPRLFEMGLVDRTADFDFDIA